MDSAKFNRESSYFELARTKNTHFPKADPIPLTWPELLMIDGFSVICLIAIVYKLSHLAN